MDVLFWLLCTMPAYIEILNKCMINFMRHWKPLFIHPIGFVSITAFSIKQSSLMLFLKGTHKSFSVEKMEMG